MGENRGGWCIRPNALLVGREAALQEDIAWILERAPDCDYAGFKRFWKENSLSLLHRCLKQRESYTEFYHLAWGALLSSFAVSRLDVKRKALFAIYTLFVTQTRQPLVKIPIDLKTWEILATYVQKTSGEEAEMVRFLMRTEAFTIGALVGLKTICAETPEACEIKPRKEIPDEDCDFVSGVIDTEEMESKSRDYHYAKTRVMEGIRAHSDWFPLCPLPKSQIQEKLDSASDFTALFLANPLMHLELKVALEPLTRE